MTLTIEDDLESVWQLTQHALLVPWGRFSRYLQLSERLRAAVKLKRHQDATPAGDFINIYPGDLTEREKLTGQNNMFK